MVEGGGKDRIRAVACTVANFRVERGMLIGGIKVGQYGKLTRSALTRTFGLNGILTSVTPQVQNI